MDHMNLILKAGAGVGLAVLLTIIFWAATHMRRIRREAAANEAIPRGGPKYNFAVLLGAAVVAFCSLLTFCLLQLK